MRVLNTGLEIGFEIGFEYRLKPLKDRYRNQNRNRNLKNTIPVFKIENKIEKNQYRLLISKSKPQKYNTGIQN